jgi:molybdate transport system substrate-binding protein
MKRFGKHQFFFIAMLFCAATLVLGMPAAPSAAQTPADTSQSILVFAAASTSDALKEIAAEFERQHPGVKVRTSFAASSTLAKQIEAGAAADLFLSASPEWAEYLAKKDLVDRQRDLLGNQLVIVVPTESTLKIAGPADLLGKQITRLALGDPASVPAGVYARQALTKLDLWDKLKDKVVGAADVRQALQFVERGAAEAGIVYATDASASDKVRVAVTIDPTLSEPIRYPLVLLPAGAKNQAAGKFYDYLASDGAGVVFRKRGFLVLTPANKD